MTERRAEFQRFRKEIVKQFDHDTLICARCGEKSKSTHLHHINPLIEGGSDNSENLIPLCGDCHLEWDTYSDAKISFGEFLTTLSDRIFAIMYKMSLFRFPAEQQPELSMIYQLQFAGKALKDEDPSAYWKELEDENAVFCKYPYSKPNIMLDLYGAHYKKIGFDECRAISEKWYEHFQTSKANHS